MLELYNVTLTASCHRHGRYCKRKSSARGIIGEYTSDVFSEAIYRIQLPPLRSKPLLKWPDFSSLIGSALQLLH